MVEIQTLGNPRERLIEVFKGVPIDRTARYVTSRGLHYEQTFRSNLLHIFKHSDMPHGVTDTSQRGERYGRFTVMGTYKPISVRDRRKAPRLSLRCDCGRYEVRMPMQLANDLTHPRCCLRCRDLMAIQKGKKRNILVKPTKFAARLKRAASLALAPHTTAEVEANVIRHVKPNTKDYTYATL
jgi:hypothetical protein